ncbi:hypothetical protein Tco_0544998 [Tanacetum coccineum]
MVLVRLLAMMSCYFSLRVLPSSYEMISTVIVNVEPFPDLKTDRSLLTYTMNAPKFKVQNPLIDATSASSPMVILAKSNTSARRKSTLLPLPRFWLHVCRCDTLDLDMLQSLLAKFVVVKCCLILSTHSIPSQLLIQFLVPPGFTVFHSPIHFRSPTYDKSAVIVRFFWGVQYRRNGLGIPTGFSNRRGHHDSRGSNILQQGFRTLSWSTAGGSPCTWNFTAANSVYDRGSIQAQGGLFPVRFTWDSHLVCLFSESALLRPGFHHKDFITRRVLLRCDSTGELYPVMKPSTIPHAFLPFSHTWHQYLASRK